MTAWQPIRSLNGACDIADLRMDNGDEEAAQAIRFCVGTADLYLRITKMLAWACVEKTARKRAEILERVRAEMNAACESTAILPMRPLPAPPPISGAGQNEEVG